MNTVLKTLIDKLDVISITGDTGKIITAVCYDTRKTIEKGSLFVCIEGTKSDSHEFAAQAVEAGAVAIIAQKPVSVGGFATVIITPDTRRALALVSAAYFGNPQDKLTTIALTGTKGKSTTSYMIKDILEKAGRKCGVIGTIGSEWGDKHISTGNSTPESYIIHETFAKMVGDGCDSVVMEVSSQGLMMNRVWGINYDVAVFTNFERDHIGEGEHADMDEYLYCKSMLFRNCKHAIFNVSDKNLPRLLAAADIQTSVTKERSEFTRFDERFKITKKPELTKDDTEGFFVSSQSEGDDGPDDRSKDNISGCFTKNTFASDLKYTKEVHEGSLKLGISFKLNSPGVHDAYDVNLSIPGRYNAANAVAAISVAHYLGVGQQAVKAALSDFRVCGRLEPVHVSDEFSLFIDYAHNAMALENVLSTLRAYNPGRLVCLFGCGGNRAKDRRYTMGEVSSRMADLSIVTSDNPRYEEPAAIIDDILVGVKKGGGKYIVIENRREAIDYAIKNGRKGDIILLAGKGNEDYQEICGVKYPFDERVVIGELMCTRT